MCMHNWYFSFLFIMRFIACMWVRNCSRLQAGRSWNAAIVTFSPRPFKIKRLQWAEQSISSCCVIAIVSPSLHNLTLIPFVIGDNSQLELSIERKWWRGGGGGRASSQRLLFLLCGELSVILHLQAEWADMAAAESHDVTQLPWLRAWRK